MIAGVILLTLSLILFVFNGRRGGEVPVLHHLFPQRARPRVPQGRARCFLWEISAQGKLSHVQSTQISAFVTVMTR